MDSLQHSPDLVYSFWESVNPDARENLLQMTLLSSASVLACTNAPDETIEAVCSTLNESNPGGGTWEHVDSFSATAIGGMQRQVWIFKRKLLSKKISKAQSLDFSSDLLVSILKKGDEDGVPMQLRKRQGDSELSAGDLLKVGQVLLSAGFSKFEALGNGGFGRAVRAMNRGRPCVLKIGMDPFVSNVVDDSLHSECEIMVNLEKQARESGSQISAKLLYFFDGNSALAMINLSGGKHISVLCMQSC